MLNIENVHNFTEQDAMDFMKILNQEQDTTKRNDLSKQLTTVFEFRSISSKSRGLREELTAHGFQFFPIEETTLFIMGIRKKCD